MDPDDALTAEALQEHYLCYKQHSGHVLIYSTYFLCDEHLIKTGLVSQRSAVDTNDQYYFNWKDQVTAFATFVKDSYNKTEGIDKWMKRAVDQDLYLKMAETGSFYFLNCPLYLYRKHINGISHEVNGDKTFFWKWYAITQAAKRRNINIESLFSEHFIKRTHYERVKEYYDNSWRMKAYRRLQALKKLFQ